MTLIEFLLKAAMAYTCGSVMFVIWLYMTLGDEVVTDENGKSMPKYVLWITAAIWPYALYKLVKTQND